MNLQDIASASAMIKRELAPLAEKIGQGAEYTFGLFVKQVYVNAFIGLIWIIPGIIIWVLSSRLIKWIKKENFTDGDGAFLYVICGFGFVAALSMILGPLPGLIRALINPEFQAIELIIQTVK